MKKLACPRYLGALVAAEVLGLVCLAGCGGGGGPKTYPVRGKVEFLDGDIRNLAGSNVEWQLQSNTQVRAFGEISDSGQFELGMIHEGKRLQGAVEGEYKGRILLPDDVYDPDADKPGKPPVHPRFLDFAKSGLAVKVPAADQVVVKVSRK
jgi:hypothetical protein